VDRQTYTGLHEDRNSSHPSPGRSNKQNVSAVRAHYGRSLGLLFSSPSFDRMLMSIFSARPVQPGSAPRHIRVSVVESESRVVNFRRWRHIVILTQIVHVQAKRRC